MTPAQSLADNEFKIIEFLSKYGDLNVYIEGSEQYGKGVLDPDVVVLLNEEQEELLKQFEILFCIVHPKKFEGVGVHDWLDVGMDIKFYMDSMLCYKVNLMNLGALRSSYPTTYLKMPNQTAPTSPPENC